jgi:sugar phosphate isomerase/epimerase
MKIGIQQYMLRDHVKSEEKIKQILKQLKRTGFQYIEMCGFLTEPHPMLKGTDLELKEAFDWPAYLKETGIGVCSIHEPIEDIAADTQKIIDRARKLGTDHVVVAGSFATDYTDLDSVKKLVHDLNGAGRRLKDAGMTLLYHNHNAEIAKLKGTRDVSLDYIYNETDPDYVNGQVDVFWLQSGGANPEAWVDKLGKRVKALHLNDAGPSDDVPGALIRGLVGRELGRGNMNLKSIIGKAAKNGCGTVILETHDNWINGDVAESMKISFDFLKEIA